MADPQTGSFLDGWAARAVAVAVALSAAGMIAYMHRDTLFPPPAAPPPEDPFQRCIDERSAEIDRMASDGVIDARQAELFKTRAEALCRAAGPAR